MSRIGCALPNLQISEKESSYELSDNIKSLYQKPVSRTNIIPVNIVFFTFLKNLEIINYIEKIYSKSDYKNTKT